MCRNVSTNVFLKGYKKCFKLRRDFVTYRTKKPTKLRRQLFVFCFFFCILYLKKTSVTKLKANKQILRCTAESILCLYQTVMHVLCQSLASLFYKRLQSAAYLIFLHGLKGPFNNYVDKKRGRESVQNRRSIT